MSFRLESNKSVDLFPAFARVCRVDVTHGRWLENPRSISDICVCVSTLLVQALPNLAV